MEPAKSTEWETPAALFADLDAAYSFDLDAAATPQNAKCARFFTAADDALIQDWNARAVWCNPPYGRALPRFIRKAWEEVEAGHAGRVVLLIPARTDTAVFHEVIFPKASRIEFLRGRVHFGGGGSAPFPSCVVVFGGELEGIEAKERPTR